MGAALVPVVVAAAEVLAAAAEVLAAAAAEVLAAGAASAAEVAGAAGAAEVLAAGAASAAEVAGAAGAAEVLAAGAASAAEVAGAAGAAGAAEVLAAGAASAAEVAGAASAAEVAGAAAEVAGAASAAEAAGAAVGVAGVLGGAVAVGNSIAGVSPTHRECTIELQNNCTNYSLCNPRMYFESGRCAKPPSPFIAPFKSDVFKFIKTPNTACGSVGVFTYDLLQKDSMQAVKKIAVMFSVPYNFVEYCNWYAVGIFDQSKECDYDLYHEMYSDTEKSFIRGKACDPCLVYKGDGVTIMAAMSDSYQPVMKVQVTDMKK